MTGAIIKVAGITGRIRGMKHKRADGQTVRPSLVVLDDPQTDESARSLSQCATRESILAGAVLGLAGPGKKISGIMPCTVIRPGDMADRILDRDKHPEWQGERTKMIYSFPANEKLWDRYAQIRAESLRAERGLADATEFYRQHRAEMDEGAIVAWPERYNHDELSAIQHAMNLKLQDERAFWAEYQNEPLPEDTSEEEDLSADQIAAKFNRLGRGDTVLGATGVSGPARLYFLCRQIFQVGPRNLSATALQAGQSTGQKMTKPTRQVTLEPGRAVEVNRKAPEVTASSTNQPPQPSSGWVDFRYS